MSSDLGARPHHERSSGNGDDAEGRACDRLGDIVGNPRGPVAVTDANASFAASK
jgi:hypothetical protein